MTEIPVERLSLRLLPDQHRVILTEAIPDEHVFPGGRSRVEDIVTRVLDLPPSRRRALLEGQVLGRFAHRHRDLAGLLDRNFAAIAERLEGQPESDPETRMLIGSYFTREYAIESAAIFNPSIVPALDQPEGSDELRFIMSLRTVGEGHISSIQFCEGTIDGSGSVSIAPRSRYAATGNRRWATYSKQAMTSRLRDLDADDLVVTEVFADLATEFEYDELMTAIDRAERSSLPAARLYETLRLIHWLAASDYVVSFDGRPLTERVLYPAGPTESHGMEDARFVRYEAKGEVIYYATYTAYDGFEVLPQLIETQDFVTFRVATLSGTCAHNKGMAIFPRPVDDMILALGRWDGQNLHLLRTDDVRRWDEAELLVTPEQPWELVNIGNCGSPIETPAGWLVLTHGVGPMRSYAIGALLLDLDNPSKVIGRLHDPLVEPTEEERDGYVPNAIYSCGGLVHRDYLYVPYGFADYGTGMLRVPLANLLDDMRRHWGIRRSGIDQGDGTTRGIYDGWS